MLGKFDNVKIDAVISAVPKTIETNERYMKILGETRAKRQAKMTGIEERRINNLNQNAADLCYRAAETVIEKTGWNRSEIKVMVFVTQRPSVLLPSTAFIIHKQLGLAKDCMVFDVNLGCSGYVAGLQIVASLLQSQGEGAKGLLLAGDIKLGKESEEQTYTVDEEASLMLFGTAGSATALHLEANHPMYYLEKSDGTEYEAIMRKFHGNIIMDGGRVFNYTINDVVSYIKEFCSEFKISIDEVDWLVFHQAQKFILQNMAIELDVPFEKVLLSLTKFGNTSSASIPMTLCVNSKQVKENGKVLMCGFGVGLACGVIYMELDSNTIMDIVETDEYIEV